MGSMSADYEWSTSAIKKNIIVAGQKYIVLVFGETRRGTKDNDGSSGKRQPD